VAEEIAFPPAKKNVVKIFNFDAAKIKDFSHAMHFSPAPDLQCQN
jgi:hypothetical protein